MDFTDQAAWLVIFLLALADTGFKSSWPVWEESTVFQHTAECLQANDPLASSQIESVFSWLFIWGWSAQKGRYTKLSAGRNRKNYFYELNICLLERLGFGGSNSDGG